MLLLAWGKFSVSVFVTVFWSCQTWGFRKWMELISKLNSYSCMDVLNNNLTPDNLTKNNVLNWNRIRRCNAPTGRHFVGRRSPPAHRIPSSYDLPFGSRWLDGPWESRSDPQCAFHLPTTSRSKLHNWGFISAPFGPPHCLLESYGPDLSLHKIWASHMSLLESYQRSRTALTVV